MATFGGFDAPPGIIDHEIAVVLERQHSGSIPTIVPEIVPEPAQHESEGWRCQGAVVRADAERDLRGDDLIADPTVADAILDRLVHNAHRIELQGESMRKQKTATVLTGGENGEINHP